MNRWVPALLAVLLPLASCKRSQAPVVEDLGGAAAGLEIDGDMAGLAPTWNDVSVVRVDNGMLVFRLVEEGTPQVHLRVLLPIPEDEAVTPESVAVVAHAMRAEIHRRVARLGVEANLDTRPGRVELSIHTDRSSERAARAAVLRVLRIRPSSSRLEAVRRELQKYVGRDHQWAELAGILLGRPASREVIRPEVLRQATAADLGAAWEPLTDPRRAVIIAHDGDPSPAPAWLEQWKNAWTRKGRVQTPDDAIERLSPAVGEAPRKGHLLASPAAPLTDLGEGGGRAVVVLGRRIAVPDARSRGLARLTYRVLQEELDARMTLSGDVALLTVRVSVGGREPLAALARTVDRLQELAATELPATRLHQAARLWLGARVVQASLDGEDLTSLWRDSIDLAGADTEIPTALALEAKTMLEATPTSMLAFTKKWLDPRAGQGGWAWVLGGGDAKIRKALREEIKIVAPDAG